MKKKTHRLFFALWPSQHERQAIVDGAVSVTGKLPGRIISSQNLHITLHFIGQVGDESKDCLHAAARSVSGRAFDLSLDQFGYFGRAKILWLGPSKLPDALMHLHQDLAEAISSCGYQSEKREYRPHFTLMRKCTRPVSLQHEIALPWSVNEFVLLESVSTGAGVSYQVIERYPLA